MSAAEPPETYSARLRVFGWACTCAISGHSMNEIRPLTGIRGIAALTVFLAHTQETLLLKGIDLSAPTLIERLLLSGGRQVDIFFVLSGFILTLIYH